MERRGFREGRGTCGDSDEHAGRCLIGAGKGNAETMDESPVAYKPMEAIVGKISETVDVAERTGTGVSF